MCWLVDKAFMSLPRHQRWGVREPGFLSHQYRRGMTVSSISSGNGVKLLANLSLDVEPPTGCFVTVLNILPTVLSMIF
jgi:hypothetical protein